MSALRKLRHYRDLLRFFAVQRFSGFSVPDEPHFDDVSTPLFMSLLGACKLYLEYGSGGSTVVAARLGKPFISVDTDRFFIKSVGKKIGGLSHRQRLIHADIGLTGPWGFPLRTNRPSARRINQWKSYARTPWRFIGNDNPPDLILVDGRFRVASALTCFAHLRDRRDARILVDDYSDRPHYHVLEQHAGLIQMCGRMAVFKASSKNGEKLTEAIDRHSTDWR